jgi:GT2 family glycosyltransferase
VKLSVILITHNSREMTLANARRAAETLSGTGLGPGEGELLVVDNGSSDGTAEALASRLPEARVLRTPDNLGYARAANLGARAASGGTLLFLNSDAELTPEALKALRATFLAHPRAGAVGAFLLDPDGSPQRSADGTPTLLSELGAKSLLRLLDRGRFPSVKPGIAPVAVPTLVGACQALSREAFDAVGGFDERFFMFLEETDLCLRLRQLGWQVFVAPAARVTHGQGRTARRALPRARVEYDLSRYRFFRKHRGLASVVLLYAGTLARLLGGALLNGFGVILTLGMHLRWRDRAISQGYRLAWHLVFCPPGWGLEGLAITADESRAVPVAS